MREGLYDSCIACKHCTINLKTERYTCDKFKLPPYPEFIGCEFYEKEESNELHANNV